jgi:POT family proton-dependent oligopeptide transporter
MLRTDLHMTTLKTRDPINRTACRSVNRRLRGFFVIEGAEAFTFFGTQAILLLYLQRPESEGGPGLDIAAAVTVIGSFGAGLYLATIVGTWLADHQVGPRRVLIGGGALSSIGYLWLAAMPPQIGLLGLVLVCVGCAGIKATAASQISVRCAAARVDSRPWLIWFYAVINVGNVVGTLTASFFQNTVGPQIGFAVAALVLLAGMVICASLLRHDGFDSTAQKQLQPGSVAANPARNAIAAGVLLVGLMSAAGALALWGMAALPDILEVASCAGAVWLLIAMGQDASGGSGQPTRILGFLPYFAGMVLFWALYKQQYTTLSLLFLEQSSRRVFGLELPLSAFLILSPILIVALSQPLVLLWRRLGPREPSDETKFIAGLAIIGVAFLSMIPTALSGAKFIPTAQLVLTLVLFTVAELLLAPTALGMVQRVTGPRFRTRATALVFLGIAMGNALSGKVGAMTGDATKAPMFIAFSTLCGVAVVILSLLARANRRTEASA